MDKFEQVLTYMLNEKYLNSHDLIYKRNDDLKINLSVTENNQFNQFKKQLVDSNDDRFVKIELPDYDNKGFYISQSKELITYIDIMQKLIYEDEVSYLNNELDGGVVDKNIESIMLSRIYSEIEGSLEIESVHSSRKKIKEIIKNNKKPENINEQIIKNMYEGIKFISKGPAFNEQNLFELYSILSKGCLNKENELLDGNIYRHDEEIVDAYECCPHSKIKECMDGLFSFVNAHLNRDSKSLNEKWIQAMLPHIAHYYILYIHPYFDYNGRTSRMVSMWILWLQANSFPPVISEAIDQTKNKYYSALSDTRDNNNDLTYFLLYIYKVGIAYFNCYKNISIIEQELLNKGIDLTDTEKAYIKKILISSKGNFMYKDFCKWIKTDLTKSGALKILNIFVKYKILKSTESKSNAKLFAVNDKIVTYSMKIDI